MSTPPSELDRLAECLKGLTDEHRRLLDLVRRHDAAMRTMDAGQLGDLVNQQEQCRTRIAQAEARRRLIVASIVRQTKLAGEPTLSRLATAFPTHRARLLTARDELKALAGEIKQRTTVSARIAQSLLGHLNTAVRLIAGAVKQANVYTKQGTPSTRQRIGVMEAVA